MVTYISIHVAKRCFCEGKVNIEAKINFCYLQRQQVVMTRKWAEKYPNIHFSSMHPGWADTPGNFGMIFSLNHNAIYRRWPYIVSRTRPIPSAALDIVHVMQYSGTSHDGLSEMWTTSVRWTNNMPLIDFCHRNNTFSTSEIWTMDRKRAPSCTNSLQEQTEIEASMENVRSAAGF